MDRSQNEVLRERVFVTLFLKLLCVCGYLMYQVINANQLPWCCMTVHSESNMTKLFAIYINKPCCIYTVSIQSIIF